MPLAIGVGVGLRYYQPPTSEDDALSGPPLELVTLDGVYLITADGAYLGVPDNG